MPYYFFALNVLVLALVINILLSIYGIIRRPSLIKKIIAITILNDSICVLAIYAGFRISEETPKPPVHEIPFDNKNLIELIEYSVDPLPQAIVITAIVIGLAFIIFLAIITIKIYELSGTTDIHLLLKREIRAEEVEEEEEEVEVYV